MFWDLIERTLPEVSKYVQHSIFCQCFLSKKMPFFSNLPRFALIRDTAKKHYIENISSILRSRDLKLLRLKITNFIDILL